MVILVLSEVEVEVLGVGFCGRVNWAPIIEILVCVDTAFHRARTSGGEARSGASAVEIDVGSVVVQCMTLSRCWSVW
jgi:hypothetical protein